MIILSNSIAQTLAPGQSLVFDVTVLKTGCNTECHRNGSAPVTLNKSGIYDISVKANVTAEQEGTVELAVMASGGELAETLMVSTPAAVGDINTIACNTALRPCGCCGEAITLQNVGTIPVVVSPGACLFVKRIA